MISYFSEFDTLKKHIFFFWMQVAEERFSLKITPADLVNWMLHSIDHLYDWRIHVENGVTSN